MTLRATIRLLVTLSMVLGANVWAVAAPCCAAKACDALDEGPGAAGGHPAKTKAPVAASAPPATVQTARPEALPKAHVARARDAAPRIAPYRQAGVLLI